MKANGKWQPKIEHDIPVPGGQPESFCAILRQLKPKDSLWVPENYKSGKVISVAGAQILGKGKWAMRKERNGHRIWRLK